MSANVNLRIYEENYTAANVELAPSDAYERGMIAVRQDYLRRLAPGKDVIDLGCGTGSYLRPILPVVRRAYAIDFSRNMLRELVQRAPSTSGGELRPIEADARSIPLRDACVDLAFSFTTLYHIPEVERTIAEIGRLLRPGGTAILEFGNLRSLNTILSNYHHRHNGWARPYHVSLGHIEASLEGHGLTVREHRAFQLLPMYGCPRRLAYLYPLLAASWRGVMARPIRDRMLDERVSGARLLRGFAFRHFFVVGRA